VSGLAPYVEADFEEDLDVDSDDLVQWRQGFGVSGAATHQQGDADADLDVDDADFLIWQRQFGFCRRSVGAGTDRGDNRRTPRLLGVSEVETHGDSLGDRRVGNRRVNALYVGRRGRPSLEMETHVPAS
jgi:hypothetical protein